MKVYSGHDTTLMALLMVLGQWTEGNASPTFCSNILLELYGDQVMAIVIFFEVPC